MGDENALLLPARQPADPLPGETLGIHGVQHFIDNVPAFFGGKRQAKPMAIETESDHIPCAQGNIGIEKIFLRHISDRAAIVAASRTADRNAAFLWLLEAQYGTQQ